MNRRQQKKLVTLLVTAVIAAVGALLRPGSREQAPVMNRQAQTERLQPGAGEITGRVVKVADGDTVTILHDTPEGPRQVKIRLLGIDAPEKSQPFGMKCRENLASLIAGKEVRVITGNPDRYGRTIGKIMIGDTDANLAQIQAGCAWHYKQYVRNQTPEDRQKYAAAELDARANHRGLWSEGSPEEPWSYRREAKQEHHRKRNRATSSFGQ